MAATARKPTDLAGLGDRFGDAVLPLALDVTGADGVRQAVGQAHAHFGRLDVVLTKAGYTLIGTVEEAGEAEVRAVFDANVPGTRRVVQAVLPLPRQQGDGHIVSVSSFMGLVGAPVIGLYRATKWAIERLYDGLSQEVRDFGIKVTRVEPGADATDLSSRKMATGLDAYARFRKQGAEQLSREEKGDPAATGDAIPKLVDADQPPLRFILGSSARPRTRAACADRVDAWEAWAVVSNSAQGGLERGMLPAHGRTTANRRS